MIVNILRTYHFGINRGSESGSERGLLDEMFEVNEDGKVEGGSFVEFMRVEVGTELGSCDGISDGRDVVKLGGLG